MVIRQCFPTSASHVQAYLTLHHHRLWVPSSKNVYFSLILTKYFMFNTLNIESNMLCNFNLQILIEILIFTSMCLRKYKNKITLYLSILENHLPYPLLKGQYPIGGIFCFTTTFRENHFYVLVRLIFSIGN